MRLKMSSDKATVRPWKIIGKNIYSDQFSNYDKEPICKMYSPCQANAELICKAVNAYGELIEIAKDCLYFSMAAKDFSKAEKIENLLKLIKES